MDRQVTDLFRQGSRLSAKYHRTSTLSKARSARGLESSTASTSFVYRSSAPNVDANSITDDSVRTKEWFTNESPPATPDDQPTNNVKLITYTDLTVYPVIDATPGLMLRVFLYGARDSKDEQILANYQTTTDASALTSDAIRAYLDGDPVPSTPSGLV